MSGMKKYKLTKETKTVQGFRGGKAVRYILILLLLLGGCGTVSKIEENKQKNIAERISELKEELSILEEELSVVIGKDKYTYYKIMFYDNNIFITEDAMPGYISSWDSLSIPVDRWFYIKSAVDHLVEKTNQEQETREDTEE